MKKGRGYDVLFYKSSFDKGFNRRLNLYNAANVVDVVAIFITIALATLILVFDTVNIVWYIVPMVLVLLTNVFKVWSYRYGAKSALFIFGEKRTEKCAGVYSAFYNFFKRNISVSLTRLIVGMFWSVIVIGVMIYSHYSIGTDITMFLRTFITVMLLIGIAVDKTFDARLIVLSNQYFDKYSLDIQKMYYEQCKNTSMPVLKTKKPSRLLMFVGCALYGKPDFLRRFNGSADKSALKGIKPPFLIINNHGSPADFRVVTPVLYPTVSNYIVSYGQFVGHAKLFQNMGIIPKRQFDNSLGAIREAQKVFKRKGILTFYPEGKVSSDGRAGIVRPAMAKFIKMCGVPVVFMHTHGIYVARPKWAQKIRKFKVSVEFNIMLSSDDVKTKSVDQINEILQAHFASVDDFAWQKQNRLVLKSDRRALGLNNILYSCPNCGVSNKMSSDGNTLFCSSCGKKWNLTPLNELKAVEGKTEFVKITDWYDWERTAVNKEVSAQKYSFSSRCELHFLPDFKGWHSLGMGSILQSPTSFTFVGDDGRLITFDTKSVYSIPYDFEYGLYFNDERFTYRVVLPDPSAGTRVNFAVEEYFKINHNET